MRVRGTTIVSENSITSTYVEFSGMIERSERVAKMTERIVRDVIGKEEG